jgi:hypothetical protein
MIVPPFIELAEPDPSLYQLIARAKKRHAGSGSAKQFFQSKIYAHAKGKWGIIVNWISRLFMIRNAPVHGRNLSALFSEGSETL